MSTDKKTSLGDKIRVGLLILSAIAVVLFIGDKCQGTKEPITEVVEVEKPGDWVNATDSSQLKTIDELRSERDGIIGDFNQFRQRTLAQAQEAANKLKEQSAKAAMVGDLKELLEIRDAQIAAMAEKAKRDSMLIDALFAAFDAKTEMSRDSGVVSGEHFNTYWKLSVFGKIPQNGLLLKTDVFYDSVTVIKPVEVFRKNSFEAFTGLNQKGHISLGLGYERRGKYVGGFVQTDYTPLSETVIARGGVRLHF